MLSELESTRPSLRIRRCASDDEMAFEAARAIVKALRGAIHHRGRAVWIASTGRTVVPCYARLVSNHARDIDWRKVVVVQMDELDEQPHALTARHFLMDRLIEPLGITRHMLLANAGADAVERVERRTIDARPDLALHGIGENGHIGLNEPGSAFDSRARVVTLAEETRRSKDLETTRGSTLGLGLLCAVRENILVASGARKREALARALFGPVTRDVPASGLRRQGRLTVLADGAAL